MRKRLKFVLMIGVIISFASAQEILKMSSLAPGTSAYLVNSTFVNIVNEALDDVEIQLNATGAGTMHTLQTAMHEIDLSMGAPTVYGFLSRGERMYAEVPDAPELAKNLRGLAAYPIGPYHFVVNADSGITSLADLEGKRVYFGPPGGAATVTVTTIFEGITGLSAENDVELVNLGWAAAQQAFQDGQLDFYSVPTLAPSPGISQIALTKDIMILGIADDEREASGQQGLVDRGMRRWQVIPAGTYGDNQTNSEDVYSIESLVSIETHNELPTDLAYRLTKAWWEGVEAQRDTSPWLEQIVLEDAFIGMATPLHAGAIQYYQEVGMEIPEQLLPPECAYGNDGMVACAAD